MHPGLFGCHTSQWITGRTSAKVRAMKSRRNFSQRTHPIHPIGPILTIWCVSYYLGAHGTVCLPYETRCNTGRTSAKVRATKSRRIFFATNAPDAPHWTLSRRFGLFRTIWVHSGLFGCLTKLGAKRAELVQKFVPRSRVRIFCNECT